MKILPEAVCADVSFVSGHRAVRGVMAETAGAAEGAGGGPCSEAQATDLLKTGRISSTAS